MSQETQVQSPAAAAPESPPAGGPLPLAALSMPMVVAIGKPIPGPDHVAKM